MFSQNKTQEFLLRRWIEYGLYDETKEAPDHWPWIESHIFPIVYRTSFMPILALDTQNMARVLEAFRTVFKKEPASLQSIVCGQNIWVSTVFSKCDRYKIFNSMFLYSYYMYMNSSTILDAHEEWRGQCEACINTLMELVSEDLDIGNDYSLAAFEFIELWYHKTQQTKGLSGYFFKHPFVSRFFTTSSDESENNAEIEEKIMNTQKGNYSISNFSSFLAKDIKHLGKKMTLLMHMRYVANKRKQSNGQEDKKRLAMLISDGIVGQERQYQFEKGQRMDVFSERVAHTFHATMLAYPGVITSEVKNRIYAVIADICKNMLTRHPKIKLGMEEVYISVFNMWRELPPEIKKSSPQLQQILFSHFGSLMHEEGGANPVNPPHMPPDTTREAGASSSAMSEAGASSSFSTSLAAQGASVSTVPKNPSREGAGSSDAEPSTSCEKKSWQDRCQEALKEDYKSKSAKERYAYLGKLRSLIRESVTMGVNPAPTLQKDMYITMRNVIVHLSNTYQGISPELLCGMYEQRKNVYSWMVESCRELLKQAEENASDFELLEIRKIRAQEKEFNERLTDLINLGAIDRQESRKRRKAEVYDTQLPKNGNLEGEQRQESKRGRKRRASALSEVSIWNEGNVAALMWEKGCCVDEAERLVLGTSAICEEQFSVYCQSNAEILNTSINGYPDVSPVVWALVQYTAAMSTPSSRLGDKLERFIRCMLDISTPEMLNLQVSATSRGEFGNPGDNALTWCIYLGRLDWVRLIVNKLEASDIAALHKVIALSITESRVVVDKVAFCMQLFGLFAQKLGGQWLQDMVSPNVISTAPGAQGVSVEVLLMNACEKWLRDSITTVQVQEVSSLNSNGAAVEVLDATAVAVTRGFGISE